LGVRREFACKPLTGKKDFGAFDADWAWNTDIFPSNREFAARPAPRRDRIGVAVLLGGGVKSWDKRMERGDGRRDTLD
jgi:hypothetical protein